MCSGHAHRLLRRRPPPRRLRGRLGGRRADAAPARDHREGDGHGGIFLHDPAHARPFTFFPLRVHDFGDGVHVVADVGGGAHVGKRVTAIDGVPLAQVLVSVRPLIAHDNASTVRLLVPEYLVCAEFLRGLGIVKGVRAARKPRFRSLVIDVRHNGGGDNTTYWPLLDLIESRPLRGKVVVLMGRMTFSAAGNFVAAVDYRTTARLVGEPSGGAPNQWGDRHPIELPLSGLTAYVAAVYVEVVPRDRRHAVQPDVRVEPTVGDFLAGRDPVLRRALALR